VKAGSKNVETNKIVKAGSKNVEKFGWRWKISTPAESDYGAISTCMKVILSEGVGTNLCNCHITDTPMLIISCLIN
jgi:hypothetical protein